MFQQLIVLNIISLLINLVLLALDKALIRPYLGCHLAATEV